MLKIIGGKLKGRVLVAPKTDQVRPTTSQLRETLFNICQHSIVGAHFLDLFAGSGAIGLEALSRGARSVTFVENNRHALAVIKKNIATLKVEESVSVYGGDVFHAINQFAQENQTFDLIYADPPYGEQLGAQVLEALDHVPLLATGGLLFIEDTFLHEPPLAHLQLVRKRKVGNAFLYEYIKTSLQQQA